MTPIDVELSEQEASQLGTKAAELGMSEEQLIEQVVRHRHEDAYDAARVLYLYCELTRKGPGKPAT